MSTGASRFAGSMSRGRRTVQASIDRFLQFSNDDRPHRGYRLNGRTPGMVFEGAVAA